MFMSQYTLWLCISFNNAMLGSCHSDIKQRTITISLYAVGKGKRDYYCCGREMIAGAGFEHVREMDPMYKERIVFNF